MPALENIRWERFCQNIVAGVAKNGQKTAKAALILPQDIMQKMLANLEDQPKSAPANC